jgi:hypothetical protein
MSAPSAFSTAFRLSFWSSVVSRMHSKMREARSVMNTCAVSAPRLPTYQEGVNFV